MPKRNKNECFISVKKMQLLYRQIIRLRYKQDKNETKTMICTEGDRLWIAVYNLFLLFLTRECAYAQWKSYSDGGVFTWLVVNFQACAVNKWLLCSGISLWLWSKLANFAFSEGKHTSWKWWIEKRNLCSICGFIHDQFWKNCSVLNSISGKNTRKFFLTAHQKNLIYL